MLDWLFLFHLFTTIGDMEIEAKAIKWFQKKLLSWADQNERPMPWKSIKDPYLIWLSEIILQQTRVEQGWNYFLKFKKSFPRVEDLAKASEQNVMKHWQGLGYYSRARNLHATAKFISEEGGQFKADYKWLLGLKGVGPYTAAAIASFAFELPYAVVDGNVYRVLSRFLGIADAIDSTNGKKRFQSVANKLLLKKQSAKYNQAIIDFGATICSPKKPKCSICPFQENCIAFQNDLIQSLPFKEKKLKKKTRFFHYVDVVHKDFRLMKKRTEKDIWQGLYDFPMIEGKKAFVLTEVINSSEFQKLFKGFKFNKERSYSTPFKQQLTHQTIYGRFLKLEANKIPKSLMNQYEWVLKKNVDQLPFPKMISSYLSDKELSLNL